MRRFRSSGTSSVCPMWALPWVQSPPVRVHPERGVGPHHSAFCVSAIGPCAPCSL